MAWRLKLAVPPPPLLLVRVIVHTSIAEYPCTGREQLSGEDETAIALVSRHGCCATSTTCTNPLRCLCTDISSSSSCRRHRARDIRQRRGRYEYE
mmetsp:Transcript_32966/g.72307  ORF Transcript_32966/g.72307 Transcript_32966/m.72307 type:complete len:95 (-) Transcript_32966:1168-1452(-)